MTPLPSRLAAHAMEALPRRGLSRWMGRLAGTPAPDPVLARAIDAFVRAYGVDLSEAVVPEGGFRSFDDFFTRALVPGARPLPDDPSVLVSPSDGRVEDTGPIDPSATLCVKGRAYRVPELLDEPEAGERYRGGAFAVIYLAPSDYHRVHAPVSGPVVERRLVPGTLYPVNRLGVEHVPGLFARNERVSVRQESHAFGEVTTVLVGAFGVGRIRLAFEPLETNRRTAEGPLHRRYESPIPLDRGAELGAFHLGSTVVVLIARGAGVEFVLRPGARVHMGEALARRVAR